mmetsp:Transcript_33928/g.83377  ORF Transcript_33928/g.83377 Transcript_33928/m.83377 type:complete len:355 (-) Transcript_33928:437-1501(-)|eukprot:CAMPEP_0206226592 /NCGR_PEP_ID=MMETSP0047_2-20121206/8178_1 /ASSEMBLY_ACC=CAM_ASM_000192 /TAXON_ID=195065 /ORGANISM="Chroomonas mesostigmatica_cf, Strain CCMP1168" /LENGTH=354 /DNA_ID=CAMNT_0053649699 /DNA_START=128 /DNA_END=1192 /DNA_ORIENTATION=+
MSDAACPRLTSLSHGGGCGCKIAPAVLEEILSSVKGGLPVPDALLVGREANDDAAVYKLNEEQAIVCTTDFFMPIVDDPCDFGRIAATNAISDVYAMGAKPILALAIVCMPIKRMPAESIAKILEGGQRVCTEAGIPIAGGHTIDGLEAIYGLVVVGVMRPADVKKNSGAQDGDVLILSKPIGIGILSAALKNGALSEEGYKEMVSLTTKLNTPGIALSSIEGVHAITDVTGFGVGGHSLEIARASNKTLKIGFGSLTLVRDAWDLAQDGHVTGASGRNWESYGKDIELWEGAQKIHRDLLTDPQTSGGLLVCCSRESAQAVMQAFSAEGFEAFEIGSVHQAEASQRPKLVVSE